MQFILLLIIICFSSFSQEQRYDCEYLDKNCINGRESQLSEEERSDEKLYCNSFLKHTEFEFEKIKYYISPTGSIYLNQKLSGAVFLKLPVEGSYKVLNLFGKLFLIIFNEDFLEGTYGSLYLLNIKEKNFKRLLNLPFNEGFFFSIKESKVIYADSQICKKGNIKVFNSKHSIFLPTKGICPKFTNISSKDNIAVNVYKKDSKGNIIKDGFLDLTKIDCEDFHKGLKN